MPRKLEGEEAFSALREMLEGCRVASETIFPADPPLERVRVALLEEHQRATKLDLAVLLRHALLYQNARRSGGYVARLRIPHRQNGPGLTEWRRVGIEASEHGGHWELHAKPWAPAWLADAASRPVDLAVAKEEDRRTFHSTEVPGDPFLRAVNCHVYRSSGQRTAVRSTLSMAQGTTLLVGLPTGEGKSLLFQLIDRIGFGDTGEHGVTLVVVPTVTLALDHEKSETERYGENVPKAYVGGQENSARNRIILERIEEGVQGLCFASPEAVTGPMRKAIGQAAAKGCLRALVIDEAHLIEGWGTEFRPEFQVLSGVRHELLSLCPYDRRFRTVLLSATLTQQTFDTLKTLFGGPGAFGFVSALTVRPEIELWIGEFTEEEERQRMAMEAICHLPRPVILYVTKVEDAKEWYARLLREGFGRLDLVHGKTPSEDRENVLAKWRSGKLDLVVATSAFGLGIDYPHVRAVVHACIPETLDRFYQEVGRGGRDGRTCLSLILPTREDLEVARQINRELVISIERGLQRWKSMFEHTDRIPLGEGRFILRLDISPGHNEQDIDMHGKRSTQWNVRTLTLMARAGLIQLLGIPAQTVTTQALNEGVYQTIKILDAEHLTSACWQNRVAPVRDSISASNSKNLDYMVQYLRSTRCPAEMIAELYRINLEEISYRVALNCGGCPIGRKPAGCGRLPEPVPDPPWPWPISSRLSPSIVDQLDSDGRLVVYYDPEHMDRPWRRRLGELLKALYRHGVRKMIFMGEALTEHKQVLSFAEHCPVFFSTPTTLAVTNLPPGPEFVFVSPGVTLSASSFASRPTGSERLLLIPRDTQDPSRPGIRFLETYGGRDLSLDEFHGRLTQ